jgi:hypothetical protein
MLFKKLQPDGFLGNLTEAVTVRDYERNRPLRRPRLHWLQQKLAVRHGMSF